MRKHVILAAGSEPIELPFAKFDNEHILDNAGALDFSCGAQAPRRDRRRRDRPGTGQRLERLGSEVTILEALPDFLAAADADIAKAAAREFKKQGLDIKLGAKLGKAEIKGEEVHLTYSDASGETEPGRRQAAGRRRPPCRDRGPAGRGHRREAEPARQ